MDMRVLEDALCAELEGIANSGMIMQSMKVIGYLLDAIKDIETIEAMRNKHGDEEGIREAVMKAIGRY